MRTQIDHEFRLGEFVYSKTDPFQSKAMIVSIIVDVNNGFRYVLNIGPESRICFEEELSRDRDYDVLGETDDMM